MGNDLKPDCTGLGADGDHCCYQAGQRCPHLRENEGGRRYACGLMLELGSWEAMNADPRYEPIGRHWESIGQPFNYCETFNPMFCCRRDLNPGFHNEKEAQEAGVF